MKISRMLRYGLVSACMLIVSSCLSLPSIRDMSDESFNPSDEESLVFGRIEIIGNGVKIKPIIKHYLIKDRANRGAPIYLSMYRLIEKPSTVLEMGKNYHILVFREDGYFSAALPPGKYGIYSVRINMEKIGFNLLTTSSQHHVGHEKRTDIPGNYKWYRDGSKIVFDVLPNEEVYIGTVRVVASAQMVEEERKRFKMSLDPVIHIGALPYAIPNPHSMQPGTETYYKLINKLVADELQVTEEFESARDAFLSIYPNRSVLFKRVGNISNERWYVKRWTIYVDQEM